MKTPICDAIQRDVDINQYVFKIHLKCFVFKFNQYRKHEEVVEC